MRRRELLIALACVAAPGPLRAAEKADSKKKRTGGPAYIPIDTLTGSTTKAGGRRGVMTVECGLDVPDAGLRARANAMLPILRAAYVQTVMIYAAGLPAGYAPNADFIAQSLQRETDSSLGRSGARVLLGAILVN